MRLGFAWSFLTSRPSIGFGKDNRIGTWSPSTADAVRDRVYEEPHGRLPVEAVAFIICEKS